jgi:hypothetical protein
MREESTRRKYCFTTLPASAALFDKPEMSDIRLRVHPTDKVFHAHRAILSAASEVFATMLGGSWAESKCDELVLHEELDCANVFDIFLYFIYSGSVAIRDDYVVPLFLLAGKYDVRSLGDECAKLIERALHVFIISDKEHSSNSETSSLHFALSDSSSSSSTDVSSSDMTDSSDMSDIDDGNRTPHAVAWPAGRPTPGRRRFGIDQTPSRASSTSTRATSRKTHMIASETFAVSVVLRLLDRCHGNERVRRAALFNLEARVGNQICMRNYSAVWLELGTDVVTAMLGDSRFGYPESKLFSAAEAWLLARSERWQSPEVCTAVLKCIRYPLLPIRELYDVQRNALVKSNDEASALVVEAMRYRLFYDCSSAEDRARWVGPQFKTRVIPNY